MQQYNTQSNEKVAQLQPSKVSGEVLITGGLQRKTLAASKLLSQKGLKVTVGESSILSPTLWSRYCWRRLIYPDPKLHSAEHVDFMAKVLKKHAYDLLLPVNDYELHLYSTHKAALSKHTRVAAPEPALLPYCKDKFKMIEAAEKFSIPHPQTFLPKTPWEIRNSKLPSPSVIKPRVASGSRGLVIVEDKTRLVEEYKRVHKNYPFPIIQEYIPSHEAGNVTIVVMDHDSQPMCTFSYVRLREYPVKAGVSTLVESVKRPDQEKSAVKLLKRLGWVGVAMVEFRRDSRDGVPKLVEINGRLNASTLLAIASGVPIPYMLYELYVLGKTKPVFNYKTGMRCRWLWPGDVLHFLTNPKRFSMKPSFFDLDKSTVYDFFSLDDPLPLMVWNLWMVKGLFSRQVWDDYIMRTTSKSQ